MIKKKRARETEQADAKREAITGQRARKPIQNNGKKTGQTLGKKTKPETKYGSEKKVKSKKKKIKRQRTRRSKI